jgi:hypothetical protein
LLEAFSQENSVTIASSESISFESDSFVSMPERSQTQMSIMPVVKMLNEQIHPVGTCFSISNDGLCLTARHVIEAAFPDAVRSGRALSEEDGWLYAVYASPEKVEPGSEHDLGGLIPFNRVFFMDRVDIAAIHLALPTNTETGERLRMPSHRLALSPPPVGARCIAIGYHAMEWTARPDGLTFRAFGYLPALMEG